MAKSALAGAILLVVAGCTTIPPAGEGTAFAGPFDAGLMAEPRNRESSGLAASRHKRGVLWTHADSGGMPVLYALDAATGEARGQVRIEGVDNLDWEDLASFQHEGRAWLCIGDVGDNNAQRPHVLLHFVIEPPASALAAGAEIALAPAYSLRVIFEDGARDCEAVAVDAREQAVYLLSKREAVPRLYRVPLAPSDDLVVARHVGDVPHLPQPTALQRTLAIPTGLYRGSPCAMDFAADGSAAVVLTYGDVLYFPRRAGESWAEALAGEPAVLPPHRLPQAEALCFSADGQSLFVSSEMTMRLLRYTSR